MKIRKFAGITTLALMLVALLGSGGSVCHAGIYEQNLAQRSLLSDGKLHIFFIGTGDPELEMQSIRKPSCLAVLYRGQFMLFDAGEGAIQTMAALGLPYETLTTAFITHWHSDHFAGLPQVINGSWVHGRKTPFVVYGPKGVDKVVSSLKNAWELDAGYRTDTAPGVFDKRLACGNPIEVEARLEPIEVYKNGDLIVKAFAVDHRPVVPALGYIIELHGRKIVLSGDTRVVDSLARNSQDSDVLISEVLSHKLVADELAAQEKAGNKRLVAFYSGVRDYHADSLELAKMAEKSNVKRLFLTHFVPAIGTTKKAARDFTSGMSNFYSGELKTANDGDHLIIDINDKDGFEIEFIAARQMKHKLIRY